MEYRRCENCIFFDICKETEVCEDFAPCGDEVVDTYIQEEVIDAGRLQFYSEWNAYISQYDDF